MAEATLLAVFAHPDDESFLCGGALARYAAAGARVVLACATRGEAGEISDPALASPDTLAEVRTRELADAAAILGVAAIHYLDYQDGTLPAVPFPEGVERVAGVLAAERPTVVLTFGPEGVYGHADHVMVHRWAKQAVLDAQAAGGPAPARLYYCAPPRSWYHAVSARCRARGVPDRYGARLDWLGVPDELVTVRLDVRAQAAQRLAALRAHRTQIPAEHPFLTLPDDDLHDLLSLEGYARAWPAPRPGEATETELLAG